MVVERERRTRRGPEHLRQPPVLVGGTGERCQAVWLLSNCSCGSFGERRVLEEPLQGSFAAEGVPTPTKELVQNQTAERQYQQQE